MSPIDDQFLQLFSKVFLNSTQDGDLSFESTLLKKGKGPYTYDSEAKTVDLSKEQSILGIGHPLTYKTRLKAFLEPQVYCEKEEELSYLQKCLEFMNSFSQQELFLLNPLEASFLWDAGRVPEFFTQEIKGPVCIPHLLGHPIWIGPDKPKTAPRYFLNKTQKLQGEAIIHFLKMGDFYGPSGHIKRFENDLSKALTSGSKKCEVNGLIIDVLNEDAASNKLYLPFFFDPSFINDLKDSIID